jgi:ubiquitin-like protein Pup
MTSLNFLGREPETNHETLFQVITASADQQKKIKKSEGPQQEKSERTGTGVAEKGEKIKKDLDKLMDEIDEVLEENAEEFVKSYVQRGGE